jgi:Fe-S oxidoreductase
VDLLADDPQWTEKVLAFADKVTPFSVFVNDVLGVEEDDFKDYRIKATFHAPCHLCRGVSVTEPPRELIRKAGYEFIPADEEQTCCGFGGTYSAKFPHISAEILARKLDDFEKTGAEVIVTECPGCVMQLRGGMKKRGGRVQVKHLAEVLGEERLR